MLRRVALLVAIVIVLGTIGAVVFGRRGSDVGLPEARSSELLLPAAICHFESLIAAGDLAQAKNVFWDEVHTSAHILGADLQERDRAAGAAFYEAKGAVERDLATLAPALKTDGPAFAEQARAAMRLVGVEGADAPC